MHKTAHTILLWARALLVIAAIVALVVLLFSGSDAKDYNTAVTTRAQSSGKVAKTDILLLKSIEKKTGGDSKAEFTIFRLPEGSKAEDYLHLQAADCDLEAMGSASCTFIGDDPSAVYDLKISYLR